jgi:hypothetical protein
VYSCPRPDLIRFLNSWDSSVSIVIRLRVVRPRNRGSIPSRDKRQFLVHRVQTDSWAHPASYPKGTGAHFLRIKRPAREADHSPPSRAEVKKVWSHTSTPPTFIAWCFVEHRDKSNMFPFFTTFWKCLKFIACGTFPHAFTSVVFIALKPISFWFQAIELSLLRPAKGKAYGIVKSISFHFKSEGPVFCRFPTITNFDCKVSVIIYLFQMLCFQLHSRNCHFDFKFLQKLN